MNTRFLKPFLITVALIALAFATIPDVWSQENADPTHRGKIMMCDTSEQIIQIVGLRFGDGRSDEEALEAVNSIHGENSCGIVAAAYTIADSVVKFDLMNYTIEIFKIDIKFVYSEKTGAAIPIDPLNPIFQFSTQVDERPGIPS